MRPAYLRRPTPHALRCQNFLLVFVATDQRPASHPIACFRCRSLEPISCRRAKRLARFCLWCRAEWCRTRALCVAGEYHPKWDCALVLIRLLSIVRLSECPRHWSTAESDDGVEIDCQFYFLGKKMKKKMRRKEIRYCWKHSESPIQLSKIRRSRYAKSNRKISPNAKMCFVIVFVGFLSISMECCKHWRYAWFMSGKCYRSTYVVKFHVNLFWFTFDK